MSKKTYGHRQSSAISDYGNALRVGHTQIAIFKAYISEGNIQINITENYDIHDGVSPYSSFRYVVIPSNSDTGKSQGPNFDKMGYHEVMDYLGLDY